MFMVPSEPAKAGLVVVVGLPSRSQKQRLAPKVGIAPTSPPLQGGANLPQLLGGTCVRPLFLGEILRQTFVCELARQAIAEGERWSSRAVTLRGLPLIGRRLCF